jgi:DNA-directed RNA polymerase specialized sigma24 family protein
MTSASALDWGATLAVHERWLRRVVASRLGEPQAVDEVMQDVALAAVAQRSPLHNPARVAVWLYRLAVRHVLIYRRKAGRRRGLVDRYAARSGIGELDATPSPLAWLVLDERQKLVQDALRRLPVRDAELLILKHARSTASSASPTAGSVVRWRSSRPSAGARRSGRTKRRPERMSRSRRAPSG